MEMSKQRAKGFNPLDLLLIALGTLGMLAASIIAFCNTRGSGRTCSADGMVRQSKDGAKSENVPTYSH